MLNQVQHDSLTIMVKITSWADSHAPNASLGR